MPKQVTEDVLTELAGSPPVDMDRVRDAVAILLQMDAAGLKIVDWEPDRVEIQHHSARCWMPIHDAVQYIANAITDAVGSSVRSGLVTMWDNSDTPPDRLEGGYQ